MFKAVMLIFDGKYDVLCNSTLCDYVS